MSDQEEDNQIVIAASAMQRSGLETAGDSSVTGLSTASTVPIEPRDLGEHVEENSESAEIAFSAIYAERHGELPIEEQLLEAQQALERERMVQQLEEMKVELARLKSGRSSPKSRKSSPGSRRSSPIPDQHGRNDDRDDDSSGDDSNASYRSHLTQKSAAQSMVDSKRPKDQRRFEQNSAMQHTIKMLSEQLVKQKISQEKWNEWVINFKSLSNLLGVSDYVFNGKPSPVTPYIVMMEMCGGSQAIYAEEFAPGMCLDTFGTSMNHPDLESVEIMDQKEHLRYMGNMTLLAHTFTLCLLKYPDLNNIADKDDAKRLQNVAVMFKNVNEHLKRTTGSTITGQVQRLILLPGKHVKDDNLMAQNIRELREIKNVLEGMGILLPEVLYNAIFLQLLETGSFIRDKLSSRVNEAWGKEEKFDLSDMIEAWHMWSQDQKQQRALSGNAGGGKTGTLKANKLTEAQAKTMKKCIKDGTCFRCADEFSKTIEYAQCSVHNKRTKKGEKAEKVGATPADEKVKSRQAKLGFQDTECNNQA